MSIENLMTLFSVSLEDIPHLWEQNDILVFLIDLNDYNTSNIECNTSDIECNTSNIEYLNHAEREHIERFQTAYFKKRYFISRMVLKFILFHLLDKNSISILDISTYKNECGEVHILYHEELHICISYSENIVTLAVSKIKVGIDVETKRPLALKNTLKYLQASPSYAGGPASDISSDADLLKIWTMKEAYCKFFNKSIFSVLDKELVFNNVYCSNYLLDNKYVFSVITDSGPYTINISRLENINHL